MLDTEDRKRRCWPSTDTLNMTTPLHLLNTLHVFEDQRQQLRGVSDNNHGWKKPAPGRVMEEFYGSVCVLVEGFGNRMRVVRDALVPLKSGGSGKSFGASHHFTTTALQVFSQHVLGSHQNQGFTASVGRP